MIEFVNITRLNAYVNMVRKLDYLLKKKLNLEEKYSNVYGIDYERIKVDNGGRISASSPEKIAMALEKVNAEIDSLKWKVKEEHTIIKTQIARLPRWHYCELLVLRYLEGWKWSEITESFFGNEEDFEEEKEKYKSKIMKWRAAAIELLEAISSKPFVTISKQPRQMLITEMPKEIN
jgi:hypothetical protein